jgi:putative transposase
MKPKEGRINDRKYGTTFDHVAASAGIEVLHTPIAGPHANSMCERFLGSVRREYLDLVSILGERQLLHVVTEYIATFNHARPHQGIAQAVPMPTTPTGPPGLQDQIVGLPVRHGIQHDYQRLAA